MLTTFILGSLNTTWIFINLYKENVKENFLMLFFFATFYDLLVYEVIIIISKSLIYFSLLKNDEVSNWKKVLIVYLALLPWLFAVFG